MTKTILEKKSFFAFRCFLSQASLKSLYIDESLFENNLKQLTRKKVEDKNSRFFFLYCIVESIFLFNLNRKFFDILKNLPEQTNFYKIYPNFLLVIVASKKKVFLNTFKRKNL